MQHLNDLENLLKTGLYINWTLLPVINEKRISVGSNYNKEFQADPNRCTLLSLIEGGRE